MEIERNIISSQCANRLMCVQVGYTIIFLGKNWVPKNWSGLSFGIFAPAHNPEIGYKRIAFYANFLPELTDAVVKWPKWYTFMYKKLRFRFNLLKNFV